jgi:hypothetical protein
MNLKMMTDQKTGIQQLNRILVVKIFILLILFFFENYSFAQNNISSNNLTIPGISSLPICTIADKGKTVFNTTNNRMCYCDGINWVIMGGVPIAGLGWAQSGSVISNSNAGGVGIGTPFPLTKLTVYTPTSNYGLWHTDANVGLGTFISPSAGLFGITSNHALGFFANGLPARLTLAPSGNIGIGTAFPTNKLQIGEATNPGFQGNDLAISNPLGGGMSFSQSGPSVTGSSIMYSNSNFSFMPAYGGTGRVGIGKLEPYSLLDVDGSLSLPFVQVSSNYTPTDQDYSIIVNMQEDENRIITINLPSPISSRNREYNIKVIGCPLSNTDNVRFDRDRAYPNFYNLPAFGSKGYVAIKDNNGDLITCLFENYFIQSNGVLSQITFRSSRTYVTLQAIGTRWVILEDNFNEFTDDD